METWLGDHITNTVQHILELPVDAGSKRGFGWPRSEAAAFVDNLIRAQVAKSHGTTVGDPFPEGTPPLDHEDGKVFGICREVTRRDPTIRCYCVTNDDRTFLKHFRENMLGDHTNVLTPEVFIRLVTVARIPSGLRPRAL